MLAQISWAEANTRNQVTATLRQSVYGVGEFNRLEGYTAPLNAVKFSPDRQTFASASEDNTVKLWESKSR